MVQLTSGRWLWLTVSTAFWAFALFFSLLSGNSLLRAEENAPDAPGAISGVVTDQAGQPLADITVSLLGRYDILNDIDPYGIVDTVTKADGSYRLSFLGPGLYYVKFSDATYHYGTRFHPDTVDPAQAVLIPIAGNEVTAIDARMGAGGQITGTITFANAITPTELSLQLFELTTYSGMPYWYELRRQTLEPQSQQYRWAGLDPGRYRICATAYEATPRYWQECYDNVATIERATTITLTAAAVSQEVVIPNIDISLGDGADLSQLRGRVLNAASTPIAQITVSLIPAPTPTPMPTRPPGPPLLGDTKEAARNLVSSPQAQSDFPLYPTTWTDAGGYYTFTAVAPNNYFLWFYDENGIYAHEYYRDSYLFAQADVVSITANTVYTTDNVILQRGGQITGSITVLGEPAYAGSVTAMLDGPTDRSSAFSAAIDPKSGHYQLTNLPAGSYKIAADVRTGGGYYYAFYPQSESREDATTIVLGIGQTITGINMNLVSGPRYEGSIQGHVRADGKTLAGIRVELINGCCTPTVVTYTESDAAGAYKLEGLPDYSIWTLAFVDPAGRYGRTFAGNAATLEEARLFTMLGSQDADVEMPRGGAIRGKIYRNNGQPVAGLAMTLYLMVESRGHLLIMDATTATDGTFDLGGLRAGLYRLCFRDPHTNTSECVSHTDGLADAFVADDVAVTLGQTTKVNMVWGPDYTIHLPVVMR